MIYLDYQATTPLAPEAFEAMVPLLRDQFANPHSAHRPGRAAAAQVEVARDEIARLLPPGGRLIFTSGATEALNIAIQGAPPGGIVTIATEHAAVLDTAEAMRRQGRGTTTALWTWTRPAPPFAPAWRWSPRCWSTMKSA